MKIKMFDEAIKLAFLEGLKFDFRDPGKHSNLVAYNIWRAEVEDMLNRGNFLAIQPLAPIYMGYQQAATEQMRETAYEPGDEVWYYNSDDEPVVRLAATIVENVEGWWTIELADKSTTIVRPSRLSDRPKART